MIDEDKKHEPVLTPLNKNKASDKPYEGPEFISEAPTEKVKPPYILMLLVLLALLASFWKMYVHKDYDENAEYAAIQKKLSDEKQKRESRAERLMMERLYRKKL